VIGDNEEATDEGEPDPVELLLSYLVEKGCSPDRVFAVHLAIVEALRDVTGTGEACKE
jgi:hypothetical protein